MIKQIKIGNLVHSNINEKDLLENNPQLNDLEALRSTVIDTFNWLIGQEVKKSAGDLVKLNASNSKAVILLYKLLKDSTTINTDNLTDTEKEILTEFDTLVSNGYSDSELLLNTLKSVNTNITDYTTKIDSALKATNVDELVLLLSE